METWIASLAGGIVLTLLGVAISQMRSMTAALAELKTSNAVIESKITSGDARFADHEVRIRQLESK